MPHDNGVEACVVRLRVRAGFDKLRIVSAPMHSRLEAETTDAVGD